LIILKQFQNEMFVRFLIVGGTAALINFFSRIAYSQFVSFRIAVLIAFVTSMTFAFFLSKKYVFDKSEQTAGKQFYYFTLVNLFAAVQVWVVSVGLAEYILPAMQVELFREEIAHMTGIIIPVFTSFIGHKKLSFR